MPDATPASSSVLAPSDLAALLPEAHVRIGGRVTERRGTSLVVSDAFAASVVELSIAADAAVGDLVVVSGVLDASQRLLDARIVERIVPAGPPPPDGPSETQRLGRSGVGQRLAKRSIALRTIRAFFDERRFVEVDTPSVVPSPGLDLHLDAFEIREPIATPEGPLPAFLITSPEYQMKRLLAGGVPRCYQLARCFRKGELGARHNPEFLMLEWYRAFAAVAEIIDDTERLVRDVVRVVSGGSSIDVGGTRIDLAVSFERLAVGAAFERYAGVPHDEALAMAAADEERFFRILVDTVEPALAREPHGVFLVDYPAAHASLARLKPSDPRVCERFELYVGGVELCNGFGELTDPVEQRARFERDRRERARLGKPVYPIDDRFLAALGEGMPPSAGNALGVDRLVALATCSESVGLVQAFPIGWL